MMSLKIFFSYCHADIEPDDMRLRLLVEELEEAGRGGYDLLVDYQHPEAAVGANLQKYIERIDQTDVVVILLSRGYKDRVDEKGDTGVYREFRRIYDRWLATEENKTYGRSFLVLPLIFTDSFERSCPSLLAGVIAGDLTWLQVVPSSSKPKVRRPIAIKLRQVIRDLSDRIDAIAKTKTQKFMEEQERIFRHFLFDDTKSRWDRPENQKYIAQAFVRTNTFQRVNNRQASFLVGRKGSGKSTIAHVLPVLSDPMPALTLRVEFEDVPFFMCYNVLRSKPRVASDLAEAFNPIYSYQLFWDGFLHLFFAWNIREKLPRSSRVRALLNRCMAVVDLDLLEPAQVSVVVTRTLFVYAFEALTEFVDAVMKAVAGEPGLAGAVARFTAPGFRRFLFGKKGWQYIQAVLRVYLRDGQRILVTADGFDVMVGYFSETQVGSTKASLFETQLLLALSQIVLNKGPNRVMGGLLYQNLDFLVALPHDRFLQVRKEDRDRYQYRSRFGKIHWSGIELSALARKRLALLRKVRDDKGPPLEERLEKVIATGYPELPLEVAFTFGPARYRMSTFLYILRHSFWRPRDILFYFSTLLAASDSYRKKRDEVSSGFVRQVVSGATRYVVEDEFVKEFSGVFRNIRQVVSSFRHGSQIVSWDELDKKIGNSVFGYAGIEGDGTLEWKIETLYDIGFLGVMLTRDMSERLAAFRHAFSFNEEQLLTQKIGREDYRDLRYCIHPVFCEFLHLDTSKNDELILPLTWEYLHENEVLRGISPV